MIDNNTNGIKAGQTASLDPRQIIANQKKQMAETNTPTTGSTLDIDPVLAESFTADAIPPVNTEAAQEWEKHQREIDAMAKEMAVQEQVTATTEVNTIPVVEEPKAKAASLQGEIQLTDTTKNIRPKNRPNLAGKIDLTSIIIQRDFSETDIVRNAQTILNVESTFQVNFLQSGYMAEISALNNHELRAMSTNVTDYYSLKKKSYETIFRHIMATSLGKISFETFLKITSFLDEPTLYYGAFCQTFQGNNKYTIYCDDDKCAASTNGFEADVNNFSLVRIDGDEAKAYAARNEIIERAKTPEQLVGNSLVHKIKRVILDESSFVVDIRIPSLDDYLNEALYNKDPRFLDEFNSEIGIAFFVDQILIPNMDRFNGDPASIQWLPVKEPRAKISYISKLFSEDYQQLVEEIDEYNSQYRISYAIQNVVCPHCHKKLGDVTINMEDVLFTLTNSRRRKSKSE